MGYVLPARVLSSSVDTILCVFKSLVGGRRGLGGGEWREGVGNMYVLLARVLPSSVETILWVFKSRVRGREREYRKWVNLCVTGQSPAFFCRYYPLGL